MEPTNSKMKKIAAIVIVLAVLGAGSWLLLRKPTGPESFASGNGRIEATEVNIATKISGRLEMVLAKEGDTVFLDQEVALMDTKELEADLRLALARVEQARQKKAVALADVEQRRNDLAAANAVVSQRQSQLNLANKEIARSQKLVAGDFISQKEMDVDVDAKHSAQALSSVAGSQLKAAQAALSAAESLVLEADAAVEASTASAEKIQVNIDDCSLTSPINGRVLYRLAEPGEIIAAGGNILTLLDITDVYMTLFLPTSQAGLVALGADARIVLDARPDLSIPAKVTFVSPEAQFTPKSVETRTEREKLMFRIKVTISPDLLRAYAAQVKTGLPGVAYVRLDQDATWPDTIPPLVEVKRPEK